MSDVSPFVRKITSDEKWVIVIVEACVRFDIDTPARQTAFLANCAHESARFTQLVENLDYSAARLLQVFGRYFSATEAIEFAHDPIRIAERVYGGRMGNGPEGVGDGWMYRGRGLLGLTGLYMYRRCGSGLGVDLVHMPYLLEQPHYAAVSAAWYWADNGLNQLADNGKWEAIVLRINGGLNGMEDRTAWLDRIRQA